MNSAKVLLAGEIILVLAFVVAAIFILPFVLVLLIVLQASKGV